MQINNGQKIAIIGGTGSGKSTLIKLLLAFYPITNGEITLDNKSYSLGIESSVRKKISVALQKAMIFEGTLKENITCFCNDYSEESILKVISVAQLDGFLQDKGGLEFELKQYGANISGGQNVGDVNFSMGLNTFTFRSMRCKLEYLKQIDDFFSRFRLCY